MHIGKISLAILLACAAIVIMPRAGAVIGTPCTPGPTSPDTDGDGYCDTAPGVLNVCTQNGGIYYELPCGSNINTGVSTPATDDDGDGCRTVDSGFIDLEVAANEADDYGAYGSVIHNTWGTDAGVHSNTPSGCQTHLSIDGMYFNYASPGHVVNQDGTISNFSCDNFNQNSGAYMQGLCPTFNANAYQVWAWDSECGDVIRALPSPTLAAYQHCQGRRSNYNLNWTLYRGSFMDGATGTTDGFGWRLISNTSALQTTSSTIIIPCDTGQDGTLYTADQPQYQSHLDDDTDMFLETWTCSETVTLGVNNIGTSPTVIETTSNPVVLTMTGDPNDNDPCNPNRLNSGCPSIATTTVTEAQCAISQGGVTGVCPVVQYYSDSAGDSDPFVFGDSSRVCIVRLVATYRNPAYLLQPDGTQIPVPLDSQQCGRLYFQEVGAYTFNFTATLAGVGQTAQNYVSYFYIHPQHTDNVHFLDPVNFNTGSLSFAGTDLIHPVLYFALVILALLFWYAWRKTAYLPYGMAAVALLLVSTFNNRYPWTNSVQIGLVVLTIIIAGQMVVEMIRLTSKGKVNNGVNGQ